MDGFTSTLAETLYTCALSAIMHRGERLKVDSWPKATKRWTSLNIAVSCTAHACHPVSEHCWTFLLRGWTSLMVSLHTVTQGPEQDGGMKAWETPWRFSSWKLVGNLVGVAAILMILMTFRKYKQRTSKLEYSKPRKSGNKWEWVLCNTLTGHMVEPLKL